MFSNRQPLASIVQVAKYFGVSYRTIKRWIDQGKLPATKVGGKFFIKWSEVDALLAKGKLHPVDNVTGNDLS